MTARLESATRFAMTRGMALLALLALSLVAAGCSKNIRIETEPPGAQVALVQDDSYPEYPEYHKAWYTTPANFTLKQKAHSIKIRRTDYDTVQENLVPRKLRWWQYLDFEWIGKKGNLLPVYRFILEPTIDERLRAFAQESAAEISAALGGRARSIAVYPYLNGNQEVTDLGRSFAGHLSFALQREMGYQPRLFEFNDVRRYFVENDQGLGARALSAGDDLAYYANQLGVDVVVVGRIRREGAATPFWKFETFVIDPQSGATLASFSKALPPGDVGSASAALDAMYAKVQPYVPPPLRQEVKTAAERLARKILEGYEVRSGGQRVNVKFTDFTSDPPYWGTYARSEFEKRVVSDSRGLLMPVPEHQEDTDLGFDAGRRQTGRPQLLSDYQLSVVGDVALRDDQVVLTARLRAPNGDVWLIETAEFTLSAPGIQRREWQNPTANVAP